MPIPYATWSDLRASCDIRVLRQICSDDGQSTDAPNVISTEALRYASLEVQSAVRVGNRYTETDLDDLQTAGDELLAGTVCDLAVERLFIRRSGEVPQAVSGRAEAARKRLEHLRKGEAIFGTIARAATSGMPTVAVVYPRSTLNLASDSRFFPPRPRNIQT